MGSHVALGFWIADSNVARIPPFSSCSSANAFITALGRRSGGVGDPGAWVGLPVRAVKHELHMIDAFAVVVPAIRNMRKKVSGGGLRHCSSAGRTGRNLERSKNKAHGSIFGLARRARRSRIL